MIWIEWIQGEVILGYRKEGRTSLFLLTKKPPFLTKIEMFGYWNIFTRLPREVMTRLICLPVITARAGNLSLHSFQNYHENIFSELDFRKDKA